MEFHTGALQGYGEPQQQPRAVQRQPATVPNNIEAVINNLAAQVRQLNTRMAAIESAIPALAANDKKTADYVNKLGDLVAQVNTQTQAAVAALRRFARGGGVQPQQFVPRASDAVVAYDTPQRGQMDVEVVDPGTGGGAGETVEVSADDMAFYGEQDD